MRLMTHIIPERTGRDGIKIEFVEQDTCKTIATDESAQFVEDHDGWSKNCNFWRIEENQELPRRSRWMEHDREMFSTT